MNNLSLRHNPTIIGKLKRLFITCIAALLIPVFTGCDNSDEPQPATEPKPPTEVPRTILVYMIANNDLGSNGFDSQDIAEMETAARQGDFGNSRLLVYRHAYRQNPQLLEITPEGQTILKTYGTEQLSVSKARMEQVILDSRTFAPAKTYGLILWSHADGWLQNGISETEAKQQRPLSFGYDNGRSMNVTSLADVVVNKDFDFIYFDCCYMASVEVAYELRDATETIVASSAELPADGTPYHLTLKHLMPEKADPVAAAKATFDYYDNLTGSSRSATLSAIATTGLNDLATATKAIYEQHLTLPTNADIQKFMNRNCYLFDFQDYILKLTSGDENFASLYGNWATALEHCILFQGATPYIRLNNSYKVNAHCGLTTNILTTENDATYRGYNELSWYNDVASYILN